MTVLIKSNVVATNSLGHISGFKGPSDFIGFLDFNLGDYFTVMGGVKQSYSLHESISCVRVSPAMVIDDQFKISEIPSNTPRVTYNPVIKKYGLCGEMITRNVVNSPDNPVSQSVTIPASGGGIHVALTVYGTGSATLSGEGLVVASKNTVATEGKPVAYSRTVTGIVPGQLSVTGKPTFVQVEVGDNNISTPTRGTRENETITLSPVFTKLVSTGDFTIVSSMQPFNGTFPMGQVATGVMGIVSASNAGVFLTRSEKYGSSGTNALKVISEGQTTPVSVETMTGSSVGGNYVIMLDRANNKLGFCTMRNARVVDGASFTAPNTFDAIFPIGGCSELKGMEARIFGGTCQYIAIYNRALSEQELASCAMGPVLYFE